MRARVGRYGVQAAQRQRFRNQTRAPGDPPPCSSIRGTESDKDSQARGRGARIRHCRWSRVGGFRRHAASRSVCAALLMLTSIDLAAIAMWLFIPVRKARRASSSAAASPLAAQQASSRVSQSRRAGRVRVQSVSRTSKAATPLQSCHQRVATKK